MKLSLDSHHHLIQKLSLKLIRGLKCFDVFQKVNSNFVSFSSRPWYSIMYIGYTIKKIHCPLTLIRIVAEHPFREVHDFQRLCGQ